MNMLSLILIAIGLSMDAFAVAISNGISMKKVSIKDASRIAAFFGVFQAIMPMLGWAAGVGFKDYITNIDHWIAFILLTFIGGKMIYDAVKEDKLEAGEVDKSTNGRLSVKMLFLLAIATSIDAMAVGISFAFLDVPIINSSLMIGIITFFISFAGVFIGAECGNLFQKKAEVMGGFILMIIGFKILAEHTKLEFISRIFR
ncbi:MAG: manganese efflux pump MntP family protein [Xylanivirga thermophila]|jgi:manganese efflux pump family protein|uniref:manganese efflux pump MntP n=1 Tax=Xylanivirga thermophila TaxID=2496273 RepID=UPI00101C5F80|nr:manganese efflux pump MntP family protein [Xylanivirga thermophila]